MKKLNLKDLEEAAKLSNFMQKFKMMYWEALRIGPEKRFTLTEEKLDEIATKLWKYAKK